MASACKEEQQSVQTDREEKRLRASKHGCKQCTIQNMSYPLCKCKEGHALDMFGRPQGRRLCAENVNKRGSQNTPQGTTLVCRRQVLASSAVKVICVCRLSKMTPFFAILVASEPRKAGPNQTSCHTLHTVTNGPRLQKVFLAKKMSVSCINS